MAEKLYPLLFFVKMIYRIFMLSIGIVGARTLNLGTPAGQSASVSEPAGDTVDIEENCFEVER